MKPLSVTIQMKAIEQYFPLVLLWYSGTLNCGPSNERYSAVLSCATVCFAL